MLLTADKVTIRGPKVDGGYSATFEVGSYEQQNIAKLLMLPQEETIYVFIPESEKQALALQKYIATEPVEIEVKEVK